MNIRINNETNNYIFRYFIKKKKNTFPPFLLLKESIPEFSNSHVLDPGIGWPWRRQDLETPLLRGVLYTGWRGKFCMEVHCLHSGGPAWGKLDEDLPSLSRQVRPGPLAHQKPCVGCGREVFFGRDPSECRSCRRVVHHLRRAADNPDVNANAYHHHVSSELPFPDLEGSRVVGTAWGRCLPSDIPPVTAFLNVVFLRIFGKTILAPRVSESWENLSRLSLL